MWHPPLRAQEHYESSNKCSDFDMHENGLALLQEMELDRAVRLQTYHSNRILPYSAVAVLACSSDVQRW